MTGAIVAGVIFVLLIVIVARVFGRAGSGRTFRGGTGAGAAGAVYDLLIEDKRKAIEIIIEERAEYRDPETADDKPKAGKGR